MRPFANITEKAYNGGLSSILSCYPDRPSFVLLNTAKVVCIPGKD